MKIKFFTLFYLFLSISVNSFCQKFAKSQFTLFSYDVSVSERMKYELSSLEGYINYKPGEKQNKVEGMLTHGLYEMTNNILTDTLNIFILPVSSMTDKAKYSSYGYPDINIRKAIKLADTKFYLKIGASFENAVPEKKTKEGDKGIFKPKVIVRIDIYNKEGYIPIQSSVGSAESMNAIEITPEFIAGMKFVDDSIVKIKNIENLKDIITRAIIEAIIKIKYKGK